MVHFYSTLRYIVYNSTLTTIEAFTTSGSDTFKRVEDLVKDAGGRTQKRDVKSTEAPTGSAAIYPGYARAGPHVKRAHARHFGALKNKRHDVEYRSTTLASILSQFQTLLLQACGGNAKISSNGLPNCSWEAGMKAYILSFP